MFGPFVFALATNFVVVGVGAIYGLNDTLCAALVGVAVIARVRHAALLCGAALGSAVLLKYFPALLVPFFALSGRRIDMRIVAASVATVILGFAVAYLVWGASVFDPVLFGVEREPKLLSVLAALQTTPWLVGGSDNLRVLLQANGGFVILAAVVTFCLCYLARLRWIEGATLGLLAVLTTYKVGHQQFYLTWLMLVAALPLSVSSVGRRMAYVCLPLALFLSLYHWGYQFGADQYRGAFKFVRLYGGFGAFTLALATLLSGFWLAFREVRAPVAP